MLVNLRAYYDSHGIVAFRLACRHRHQCAAESPRFTSVEKTVSPHLHVNYVLWRTLPPTQSHAEALVQSGRDFLEPVYRFVAARSV
jgi:hypothetical protein